MLGIPVHETVPGIRGGKVVCACRDFTDDDWELVEFHDLKNSLSDEEPGFTESASTGSGVVLADVRAAINRIPELAGIEGVTERFWDMFVTDAFIRNIDRNNTNWGVLSDRKGHYRLAPLKYIASGQDPQCTLAFGRFMERYEPDRLYALIDSIPDQAMGVTVLPEGFREYHKEVMAWRYENVFVPTWEELRDSADTYGAARSLDSADVLDIPGIDEAERSGFTR